MKKEGGLEEGSVCWFMRHALGLFTCIKLVGGGVRAQWGEGKPSSRYASSTSPQLHPRVTQPPLKQSDPEVVKFLSEKKVNLFIVLTGGVVPRGCGE